ncbi:MAG: type I phosphomannose isomerase catalytic subunit [Armatimonadota bacterium]
MSQTAVAVDYLLRCRPEFKPKIWGGRRLHSVLGKKLPPGQKIGESWEVADIPEGTSAVANGPLEGWTLRELMQCRAPGLLRENHHERFPLLVKFIDVARDTSIQVHPDADACRRYFPDEHPKAETWIVVHAEPGAAVYHGLRADCSMADFVWAVRNNQAQSCLRRVPVSVGDVIHVAPGTVHALLAGVMVLEIQEPSDSTFRIDDLGRLGPDGRPRELHVEQALLALRPDHDMPAKLEPVPDHFQWGSCELLVDCRPYTIHRITLRRQLSWRVARDAPVVASLVSGRAQIACRSWEGRARAGDTFIIPPRLGEVYVEPAPEAVVIISEPACKLSTSQ